MPNPQSVSLENAKAEFVPNFGTSSDVALKVGDRLTVTVDLKGLSLPDGTALNLVPEEKGDPVAQKNWKWTPGVVKSEILQFHLIPLKSGNLVSPRFKISQEEGPTLGEVLSQSLQVESANVVGQSPPKIFGPESLPFPWIEAIGYFIVFVILIVSLIRYWVKRPKKVVPPPMEPIMTAEEVALMALSSHEIKKWHQDKNFKKLYFRISEILKEYFGKRYGFDASESTTDEFLAGLQSKKISVIFYNEIKDYFYELDHIKFTDELPDPSRYSSLIFNAKKLVEGQQLMGDRT